MWGEKDVTRPYSLNDKRNSVNTLVNDVSGLRRNLMSTSSIRGDKNFIFSDGLAMGHRERRYIKTALENIPSGTSILNWPCERGQLLPLFKKLGYKVTSADSCSYAVMQARLYGGLLGEGCIDNSDDFRLLNIFQTGFDDDFFGAAVISHMFHRYPESQKRWQILKELRRICNGPIIISGFCNVIAYYAMHSETNKSPEYRIRDCIAFNRRCFEEEVNNCGLVIDRWIPRLSLITRQACAVLVRDKSR